MRAAIAMLMAALLGPATAIAQSGGSSNAARSDASFTLPKNARVCVNAVVGPPDALGKSAASGLRDALSKRGHADSCEGRGEIIYLRPYVLASREAQRTRVSFVIDSWINGVRVGRVFGEFFAPLGQTQDPWSAMTDEIITQFVEAAAAKLSR
jgi:hypothetical protein